MGQPAGKLLAAAGAAVALSAVAAQGLRVQVLADSPLPLSRPTDLRWESSSRLLVGDALEGTFRVAPQRASAPPEHLVGGGAEVRSQRATTVSLGLSPTALVAASHFFSLRWYARDTMAQAGETAFELIEDVDAFQNRLLVLGGRRDEKHKFGGDGDIAWIGSLDRNLTDLRPVLPSAAGPGTRTMERCGILGLGALRFLHDGSFVIVPGVDAGVFRYDPTGKLVRTWSTERLGIASCDLSDQQARVFLRDFVPAMDWLDRHRVVDEALELPQGPALVVRSFAGGRVTWDLVLLLGDGATRIVRLPFTSPSKWTRLKADANGDRVAFLLSEALAPNDLRTAASRLILTKVEGS